MSCAHGLGTVSAQPAAGLCLMCDPACEAASICMLATHLTFLLGKNGEQLCVRMRWDPELSRGVCGLVRLHPCTQGSALAVRTECAVAHSKLAADRHAQELRKVLPLLVYAGLQAYMILVPAAAACDVWQTAIQALQVC